MRHLAVDGPACTMALRALTTTEAGTARQIGRRTRPQRGVGGTERLRADHDVPRTTRSNTTKLAARVTAATFRRPGSNARSNGARRAGPVPADRAERRDAEEARSRRLPRRTRGSRFRAAAHSKVLPKAPEKPAGTGQPPQGTLPRLRSRRQGPVRAAVPSEDGQPG